MEVDYYGQTTLNPLGFLILLILGVIMLTASKRKSLIPLIIMACFIPPGQRIVIAGIDLNFIRLMIIIGWSRIILRKEYQNFSFHLADKFFLAWAFSKILLYTIQQQGMISSFIYMAGENFEALGIYFMVRILITSLNDVKDIAKTLVTITFPVVIFFFIEKSTGRNLFSAFGGVPEFTLVREGRLRVQGAFAHPILAGSFWASIIPMFIASIYKMKKIQPLYVTGILLTFVIIILCASSTPVLGAMLACLGMAFFFFRFYMKTITQLFFLGIFFLSLVMNAPIWHLIARIDIAGGSTGYYRYLLIEYAVRNFNEWILVGLPNTNHWQEGEEVLNDLVNQYILEGIRGGFLTMILFIIIIIISFHSVWKLITLKILNKDDEKMVWALGASLFTHSVMFLVVSYFGQIVMLWNMLLAIIISIYMIYVNDYKLNQRQFLPAQK